MTRLYQWEEHELGIHHQKTCCLQAVLKNYLTYHLSEKLSHYFTVLCTVTLKTRLFFVYLDVLYIFVVGCNIMSIYKTSHYCNLVQLYFKKKKNDPWFTMGKKYQKLCHIPNSPFPPGKGGRPHGKKSKSFS